MHISRTTFLLAIFVLTATYLFGGYSGRHELFPFQVLRALKTGATAAAPDRYAVDKAGRLASDEQKKAIACPQQTDRTAVLLLIGQSDAGNHAGQRYRSDMVRGSSISSTTNAMSPRHPCSDLMASVENIGPSSATSCW